MNAHIIAYYENMYYDDAGYDVGALFSLCREGKTVLYINVINPSGAYTGKTIEGTTSELMAYMVRNKYI